MPHNGLSAPESSHTLESDPLGIGTKARLSEHTRKNSAQPMFIEAQHMGASELESENTK